MSKFVHQRFPRILLSSVRRDEYDPQLDSKIWYYYDISCLMAKQHPAWNLMELQRLFVGEQAGLSSEQEEMLFNSIDEQHMIIMSEMFEQMRTKSERPLISIFEFLNKY